MDPGAGVTAAGGRRPAPRAMFWTAAAIVVVALNLRASVVGVGPLLTEIRVDESLSATAGGILTALPVLCFGLLAPVAPRMARRVGIERALLAVLVLLTAGCLVRMVPTVSGLYLGTVMIGTAVASGNVLLPALIKRDYAHRTGLMTAVYSSAISFSGALGAAVTVPLADAAGLGWRLALGAWAAWAVLGVLCWLPQLRRVARPAVPGTKVRGVARQALAWQVTAYMGLQSLGFYSASAWFASIFIDRGWSPTAAGALVSVVSVTGLLGGIGAPLLGARSRDQRRLSLAITLLGAVGIGLVLVPGLEIVACVLAGVSFGAALGLALIYMGLRSPDAAHAAQLSGMAQCVGYAVAAVGPFAVGALHDLTDGWTVPMIVVLVLYIPQGVAGWLAGRDRQLVRSGVEPVA
ncbi:CynX/NimT family MFS transporter [Pseudonocardia sulfidoxydans]|uniref:CynX/NimT family MFS transporter n=1 Tax=Pseudonocardia sulfidoxydans TaxID=54011 RepID=UPI001FECC15D|nr:MFS transporter [Pseudonocardia sulfidoxydans]